MSDVIWRRLRYTLSPQLDLYESIAPLTKGKSVLEVGFCTGIGTLQMASYASQIDAIETDPHAVVFASRIIDLPNIWWGESDILNYDTLRRYDIVLMVEVLEHIQDWTGALRMANKLLKVGGKLIMTSRNMNADLRRNELHEREWTALELKENLSRFFGGVELVDYQFNPVGTDTHITPLVALAYKTEAGDD